MQKNTTNRYIYISTEVHTPKILGLISSINMNLNLVTKVLAFFVFLMYNIRRIKDKLWIDKSHLLSLYFTKNFNN